MMIKITCPKCETSGNISLVEPQYQGPYKCWKCRELFSIEVDSGEVKLLQKLTQEEFDRQQELEILKNKFKRE